MSDGEGGSSHRRAPIESGVGGDQVTVSSPRRGEVWMVNFSPGRGSEQRGNRPALIIQNDVGNRHAATTIVAAITSTRSEERRVGKECRCRMWARHLRRERERM